MAELKLSVIIPTFNEESGITTCLRSVMAERPFEVLVVDAHSQDRTKAIAVSHGAKVISSQVKGRGTQMNLGAQNAKGTVFLFLHADTKVPKGYPVTIKKALSRGYDWGFFRLSIADKRKRFRFIEKLVDLRCGILGLSYGDQGMFITSEFFTRMGGFKEMPLLEDLDFLLRARKQKRPVLMEKKVATSSRRWRKEGFWRTSLYNQMLLIGYLLGIPVTRLERLRQR